MRNRAVFVVDTFCRHCLRYQMTKKPPWAAFLLLVPSMGALQCVKVPPRADYSSAVASVCGRKFLGYSLRVGAGSEAKRNVPDKALDTFKQRIRELTCRRGGGSMAEVVERLRSYMLGWKGYFRLAQTRKVWRPFDEWLRLRLRAIQLKHWKRGTTMYRELRKLGATPLVAKRVAGNSRSWCRNSNRLLKTVMTMAYFDRQGLPRLS